MRAWDLRFHLAMETFLSAEACAYAMRASLTPFQLPLEASEHQQMLDALWKRGTEHFSQRRERQVGLGAQTSSALHVSRAQNRRLVNPLGKI